MARAALRHFQVLQHRQIAEYLAPLRDITNPQPGDAVGRPARGVAAEHLD